MMKKMIASVLILAGMLGFAGCTDAAPETPDGGVPEAARISAELPARSPRAVILTYGNEAHYRLDKARDYEAFLDGWLRITVRCAAIRRWSPSAISLRIPA